MHIITVVNSSDTQSICGWAKQPLFYLLEKLTHDMQIRSHVFWRIWSPLWDFLEDAKWLFLSVVFGVYKTLLLYLCLFTIFCYFMCMYLNMYIQWLWENIFSVLFCCVVPVPLSCYCFTVLLNKRKKTQRVFIPLTDIRRLQAAPICLSKCHPWLYAICGIWLHIGKKGSET